MLTKMVTYLVPVDLHARSTISLADFDTAKPEDVPTERGGRTHASSTASQREGNARAFPIATRCRKRTIPFLQRQTPRRNKREREPARQH